MLKAKSSVSFAELIDDSENEKYQDMAEIFHLWFNCAIDNSQHQMMIVTYSVHEIKKNIIEILNLLLAERTTAKKNIEPQWKTMATKQTQ